MESVIQGRKIVVSEQTIRDVLQIEDQLGFPTKIPVEKTEEVLERMGYEGVFPPTMKKLLPPYWRFLAHSFVICISGRKTSVDDISLLNTGAIVALIMDLEFNFSRYVLNELKNNLQGKRKDKFLMYPRFLQMIFDSKYPELERKGDSLDFKYMGAKHIWFNEAKP